MEARTPDADARRLAWSLILSLLILAGGMTWTYRVGMRAGHVVHQLGHLEGGLEDLRAQTRSAQR